MELEADLNVLVSGLVTKMTTDDGEIIYKRTKDTLGARSHRPSPRLARHNGSTAP